jgi:hypothetical protein
LCCFAELHANPITIDLVDHAIKDIVPTEEGRSNLVLGRSYTSAGVPTCFTSAVFITATRVRAHVMAREPCASPTGRRGPARRRPAAA